MNSIKKPTWGLKDICKAPSPLLLHCLGYVLGPAHTQRKRIVWDMTTRRLESWDHPRICLPKSLTCASKGNFHICLLHKAIAIPIQLDHVFLHLIPGGFGLPLFGTGWFRWGATTWNHTEVKNKASGVTPTGSILAYLSADLGYLTFKAWLEIRRRISSKVIMIIKCANFLIQLSVWFTARIQYVVILYESG